MTYAKPFTILDRDSYNSHILNDMYFFFNLETRSALLRFHHYPEKLESDIAPLDFTNFMDHFFSLLSQHKFYYL